MGGAGKTGGLRRGAWVNPSYARPRVGHWLATSPNHHPPKPNSIWVLADDDLGLLVWVTTQLLRGPLDDDDDRKTREDDDGICVCAENLCRAGGLGAEPTTLVNRLYQNKVPAD